MAQIVENYNITGKYYKRIVYFPCIKNFNEKFSENAVTLALTKHLSLCDAFRAISGDIFGD